MGRLMPTECPHYYIQDWGDFGCQCDGVCECPPGAWAPEQCPECDGFTVPPRKDLLWLAVDLDGTLAEPLWTAEHPTHAIGAPIERNVAKLREAVAAGYKVVIHTSRPDNDYETIEAWLIKHDIPFKAIRTGKLLAALYIDDRGRHCEEESWLPQH